MRILIALLFIATTQSACSIPFSIRDLGLSNFLIRSKAASLPDCPMNMSYAERDLDRPYQPNQRVYRTKEGVLCRVS